MIENYRQSGLYYIFSDILLKLCALLNYIYILTICQYL